MDFNSTGSRSVKPWVPGSRANNMDYELSRTGPTANLHTMYIQPSRRPYGSVVLFHFCQFDGNRVTSSLLHGQPCRAVIGGGLQQVIEQKLLVTAVGELAILENEFLSFPFVNIHASAAICSVWIRVVGDSTYSRIDISDIIEQEALNLRISMSKTIYTAAMNILALGLSNSSGSSGDGEQSSTAKRLDVETPTGNLSS